MRIITPPIEPVISLEDIKRDLRVDAADDDHTIETMVEEATQWVERRTQTALLTQTREIDLPCFPPISLSLTLSRPVQSVTSVKYYDSANTQQTASGSGYYLFGDAIMPIGSWPLGQNVTVRFVAGYASVDLVPASLKAAVRLKTQELFDGVDMEAAIDSVLVNHLFLVA